VQPDVETYYRRYGPMVLRRCMHLLKDEQAAVDAMHDVFVLLLRHQARLRSEAPAGLLLRISTNVCLNRLRSSSRRPESREDALLLNIASTAEPEAASVARLLLGRLFASELDSTRALAVLHLVDGLTLEEVAREVKLSVSGVRKRLAKLRARLTLLEEQDLG
jgi:RNA polymerase sigma-70 factor (ECF subfamily)